MEQGARLFTPRSTRAMQYFQNFEKTHISLSGMFQYAIPESRQAIGMKFEFNDVGNETSLIYR